MTGTTLRARDCSRNCTPRRLFNCISGSSIMVQPERISCQCDANEFPSRCLRVTAPYHLNDTALKTAAAALVLFAHEEWAFFLLLVSLHMKSEPCFCLLFLCTKKNTTALAPDNLWQQLFFSKETLTKAQHNVPKR